MSNVDVELLVRLLSKAATDSDFRQRLLNQPKQAAIEVGGTLTDEQLKLLASMREAIERFGGDPNRHPDDADNWALGMLLATVSKRDAYWSLDIKSIKRNPAKAEKWKVVMETIKRTPSAAAPSSARGRSKTRRKTGARRSK